MDGGPKSQSSDGVTVRELVALLERSSVLSDYVRQLTSSCNSSFGVSGALVWPPWVDTHTHTPEK